MNGKGQFYLLSKNFAVDFTVLLVFDLLMELIGLPIPLQLFAICILRDLIGAVALAILQECIMELIPSNIHKFARRWIAVSIATIPVFMALEWAMKGYFMLSNSGWTMASTEMFHYLYKDSFWSNIIWAPLNGITYGYLIYEARRICIQKWEAVAA